MKRFVLAILLAVTSPAQAAGPKPLFATDDTIHIVIQGPIATLARNRAEVPRPATLAIGDETLPISLTVRGITRRTAEICGFPPLRVEFTQPPATNSLFAGQRRLKLVTHCRNDPGFQQYLLLEYAAYRMYQRLTPLSFAVRLADVEYRDDNGRTYVQRLGFFLEDTSDVAKRNGLKEIHAPSRIDVAMLSPGDAARYALFEHMLGNHDWSMRAGPEGDDCCHNAKLVGSAGIAPRAVIPIPYDFDFSGFVNAPYATPPDVLKINDVRQRFYRGYCIHNAEAAAVAAQIRAARPQILAALAATPGLDPRTLSRAQSYLDGFFRQVSTDSDVATLLKRCV